MSAPPRFSDDELIDIINATRLRSPVHRALAQDHDRIDILIPHMTRSWFRFQRDATGTALLLIGAEDQKLMRSGTLDECLNIFAERSVP